MKSIYKLMSCVVLASSLCACDNEDLDNLTGIYALDSYNFTQVASQSTTKLGRGVKKIDVNLTDGNGTNMALAFGSTEWILPAKNYTLTTGDITDGTYTVKIVANGSEVALNPEQTTMTLSKNAADEYSISIVSITNQGANVKATYNGPITFEIGEDDPEASGYTVSFTTTQVVDADKNVYADLSKYIVEIADPSGSTVAEFDLVSDAGIQSMAQLTGTYTFGSYPCQKGLADGGWVAYYPEWGMEMAGGSYYVDMNGVKQYITNGQITITAAEDVDGNPLYSFSGTGYSVLTSKNEPSEGGSVNLKFCTEMNIAKGTVLYNQTIAGSSMGDMLYTVYLPASWNGTNTYPVLYMLHGADGGNNDWVTGGKIDLQAAMAASAGTCPEVIVIMPNGTINGQNLFYCDDYVAGYKYQTWFFDEFMPAVEAMYKVDGRRECRAIGGLSMGGYGSLLYGGSHPDLFSYVYACSPATYIDNAPNLYDTWGAALGAGAKLPGITIEIGTSDFLYESSTYFKSFLDGCMIPNEFIQRDGTHDWAFWTACTPKIFAKLGEVFK